MIGLEDDYVLFGDPERSTVEDVRWLNPHATLFVNVGNNNHLRIRGSGAISQLGDPPLRIHIEHLADMPYIHLSGRCIPAEFAALDIALDVDGLQFVRDLSILNLENVSTCHRAIGSSESRSVSSFRWSGLQICALAGGCLQARLATDVVEVFRAQNLDIRSDAEQRLRIHDAFGCTLTGVHIELPRGATAIGVAGAVHLSNCHGLLSSAPRERTSESPTEPLHLLSVDSGASLIGARIQGVRLPSGPAAMAVLQRAEEASQFNPDSGNFRQVVRSVRPGDQGLLADLLFDVLRIKAQDPIAVDQAAIEVLDARRIQASGIRRLILEAYRLMGYGRSVSRPIGVWSATAFGVVAWRFALAMHRPGGYLPNHLGWAVVPLGIGVTLHAFLILFSLGQDSLGDLQIGVGVFLLLRAIELGCAIALIAALRSLLRTRFGLRE